MSDSQSNMPSTPNREEALFHAAVLLTGAERAAFLNGACLGDDALRQRLEALLAAHDQPDALSPEASPAASQTINLNLPDDPPDEAVGQTLGRYKLLERLGEGGCGVVYVAEQTQPIRRRVALKVIKLGMDTRQVVARFEAERQALAMMDHPNIAKVLEAGATETGRPFFVMELVRGIRITDYCDQNNLTAQERLGLFVQICHAIQHAHQKGIIHRDIKPSNILVTLHDGVPVPKVIDFGIAKATHGKLTDQTLYTAFEQFIGTPAYMSPEQAEMSALDIDTRSDIYSLGVLLYELLTGQTPFDTKKLVQAGLNEIRRTIREDEPARPSTRLSTMLGVDLKEIAKHRKVEPPGLIHLVRGDLDWIVMKSLEKDRTRRYETANGLAADIERHLRDEPVLARPPSKLYQFQRAVRRNKLAFLAAAAVTAALVAGLGLSTWMFFNERQARRRADAAEKEAQAGRALEARQRVEAEVGRKYAEAQMLLDQQQFDKAEEILRQTPPRLEGAGLFHALGLLHIDRKEWQPAITNFMMEIQSAPSNHLAYYNLAPLLVEVGDLDGYRRLRSQILQQFVQPTESIVAARMAEDCLIVPPAPTDVAAINKLADSALAAGPEHPKWQYFQYAEGLAEYRQGRFDDAADRLQKVAANQADSDPILAAQSDFVLAMARYQLHQFWPARGALSEGCWTVATMEHFTNKIAASSDLIIPRVLMREAQGLIETGANNETVARAFDALAGRYDVHDQYILNTITREGNHLFAELSGRTKFEISPRSATDFDYLGLDAQLSFTTNGGKVSSAVLRQFGRTFDMPRLDDVLDPTVDPASYRDLVGTYDYSRTLTMNGITNSPVQVVMKVTRAKGRLFAQITDQENLEILPKSKLEFFWKDVNAQVTFVKDENGNVIKAIHHQNGVSFDAPRLNYTQDLANADAEDGRHEEAIALLKKACEADASDTVASLTLGTWQAWFGQDADYETTRRRLIQNAQGADQANTVERAVKVYCLRPSTDAALLTNVLNMAQRAVELGKNSGFLPYFQLALGLAQYRNGQYAAAGQTMIVAEQTAGVFDDIPITAQLFRAMSLFRQDRTEEARKLFSQTEAKMPPLPADEGRPLLDGQLANHDVLIIWLAYKEAKALLNNPTAAKP